MMRASSSDKKLYQDRTAGLAFGPFCPVWLRRVKPHYLSLPECRNQAIPLLVA